LVTRDHHRTLGISPGASERQIKAAYRKLALKYHPDLNHAPDAEKKFRDINSAYKYLLEHRGEALDAETGYDDTMAWEIYKRERERMQRQARARQERKKREEEFFNRPEWHDPILFLKYILHGFSLIFALTAIVVPILLALLVEPSFLAGAVVFMVVGVFLVIYIFRQRKTWFRLGKFKTTWKDVGMYFIMQPEKASSDRCCYLRNAMAGGRPYRIELLKTLDVKTRSYGVLDHGVSYRNKVKRVVIPRSARAQYFHKVSSFVKLFGIMAFMLFFPVESLLWRFIAGIAAGGILSLCVLTAAGVRSKVSYLVTPGLIIKVLVWLVSLYMISEWGPGLNIRISSYVYLVVAGLLFFLDMFFDLMMGFFPFYDWFFRPVIKQGKVLDGLYREGFQNYQELPVYSVLYPFFRWLF
jgi:hypothetical protein